MRSGTRESIEPVCPFCRAILARPKTIKINAIEDALGGMCGTCGALYLVDQTGKNVGEVMLQALGMAAEKLSKDPSDMAAGQDYEDVILDYNWRTHRSSGEGTGHMGGGRLYVVKVKQQPA